MTYLIENNFAQNKFCVICTPSIIKTLILNISMVHVKSSIKMFIFKSNTEFGKRNPDNIGLNLNNYLSININDFQNLLIIKLVIFYVYFT